MDYRWMIALAQCGVVALALSGCDDDSGPAGGTAAAGASSTGSEFPTSSGASGSSEDGSSSQTGSAGSTDSDTDGPADPFDCESVDGVLITEFEAELPFFQVGENDVVTTPLGPICMLPTGTSWVLRLQFGPMDGTDWTSTVHVQVEQSGTYDLGADFGEPGSGVTGPNSLTYALQQGPGSTEFSTSNQVADGTLQVDDWPIASGDEISVRADGVLAGAQGWRFQFSISAVLP